MITQEELEKLAKLAKLSLDGEDMDALANDISNILAFAETVTQAAVDLPEDGGEAAERELRDDVSVPSYPADEILKNAGTQRDGYFVARRRGGVR